MNCQETRILWNLYHDSEGDPELYTQVNKHLATCSDCTRWFDAQDRLEVRINKSLRSDETSDELWTAVLTHSGVVQPKSQRRWLRLTVLVALAACLLIAVDLSWTFSRSAAGDLAQLTAARHDQFLAGAAPVEFASNSDLEVEQYLHNKIPFPVRCPPREDAGFLVDGAGVCQLAAERAAYLVGHVDEARVSIFILPRDSLAHFPRQQKAVRRSRTHRCREGRYDMVMAEVDHNVVLVVGETDVNRLVRVLKAYGTYHDGHHG